MTTPPDPTGVRRLVVAAEKLDKIFAAGDEYSGNLTWGQVEGLHVLSESLAAVRVAELERVLMAVKTLDVMFQVGYRPALEVFWGTDGMKIIDQLHADLAALDAPAKEVQ